jgi:hypothetical protein
MGFGSWRKFKTLLKAKSFVKRARKAGYFVSEPERVGKFYFVSLLTKRGNNPFFIRGF